MIINKLEVAELNAPIKLTWDDAVKYCTSLGDGWRLPSKTELNFMFENKDKIGGFASFYYWSSENRIDYAWTQLFPNGSQSRRYKKIYTCVRPVRGIQ